MSVKTAAFPEGDPARPLNPCPARGRTSPARNGLRRIVASRMPGVATADPANPLPRSCHRPVLLHRLNEVIAARWMKPAMLPQHRPDENLIAAHARNQQVCRQSPSRHRRAPCSSRLIGRDGLVQLTRFGGAHGRRSEMTSNSKIVPNPGVRCAAKSPQCRSGIPDSFRRNPGAPEKLGSLTPSRGATEEGW